MGSANSNHPDHNMRFIALFLAICLVHTAQSMCGRYTTKTVKVGASSVKVFKTERQTKRCTVLFKLDSDCTAMKLVCGRYFVPNKDDFRCRRGDKFYVKSSGSKPRVFLTRESPLLISPSL